MNLLKLATVKRLENNNLKNLKKLYPETLLCLSFYDYELSRGGPS